MTRRRLAAVAALVLGPLAIINAVGFVVEDVPQALSMLISLALALAAGWFALVRRGATRVIGLIVFALLAAGMVETLLDHRVFNRLIVVAMLWLALAAAATAFAIRVPLPKAARPDRPVLFVNPRSGGGKAERFHLADEARARGIEPVEIGPSDDLALLVKSAVDDGADGLAMAGGDGSQAVVAAVAADRNLPFACIPAGTRNHFALDLGVDREDVVGALDAFVDGGERLVDLGEVNGRVFVNNVSLGLYATALQRSGYRAAKVRTIMRTLPDVVGPQGAAPNLNWTVADGQQHPEGRILLVSNNRYRLGALLGSGTRPRIDDGHLGIAVVESGKGRRARRLLPRRLWRQWSAREFEVASDAPVAVGIDGEAMMLASPLRFRIRPAALRVRISASHPGASPSAGQPDSIRKGFRALAAIAAGRDDPSRSVATGQETSTPNRPQGRPG